MNGIWVAVPAYTGEVKVNTAHALNIETMEAFNKKIPFMVVFHEQDPIISRCRNAMVMNFLASDPKIFTDMIFLDSDVGFTPKTLLKLAAYPVDIVGAVYPYRGDPEGFPLQLLNEPREPEHGLVEVAGLPAGCLRISRRALETMVAKFPELEYIEDNVPQKKAYALFDFVRMGKKFCGEDYVFCALAREAGLRIWCDPDVDMMHIGIKHFKGNLARFMRAKALTPMERVLAFADKQKVAA